MKVEKHNYPLKSGDAYSRKKPSKNFMYTELNRKDIFIVSFEVLGY